MRGYRPYSNGEMWCRGGKKGHGHFVKPSEIYITEKGRVMCIYHRMFVRSRAVYSREKQLEKGRRQRERDNTGKF